MTEDIPENEKPRNKRGNAITGGIILIFLGCVFLADNYGLLDAINRSLGQDRLNWEALIILIPIAIIGVKMVGNLRESSDHATGEIWRQIGILLILALAFISFFLNWNIDKIWPLFLIAIGLTFLLPRLKNE